MSTEKMPVGIWVMGAHKDLPYKRGRSHTLCSAAQWQGSVGNSSDHPRPSARSRKGRGFLEAGSEQRHALCAGEDQRSAQSRLCPEMDPAAPSLWLRRPAGNFLEATVTFRTAPSRPSWSPPHEEERQPMHTMTALLLVKFLSSLLLLIKSKVFWF